MRREPRWFAFALPATSIQRHRAAPETPSELARGQVADGADALRASDGRAARAAGETAASPDPSAGVNGVADATAGAGDSFLDTQGITRQVLSPTGEFGNPGPLAPGGQLAMPWGAAQLGLDGRAYVLPGTEGAGQWPEADEGEPEDAKTPVNDRQLWIPEVLGHLEPLFGRIARRHERAAVRADKPSTRRWHDVRAKGALRRPEALDECCTQELVRRPKCDCGHAAHRYKLSCDQWKLCDYCKRKRANHYRRKFRVARKRLLARFRFTSWREKFLTLPLPHVGPVEKRIRDAKGALPKFLRLIRAHLEHDRGLPKNLRNFPWLEVLEVTAGQDADGHPHFHIWMLAPYIPHELIRLYWAMALGPAYEAEMPVRSREQVLAEAKRPAQLAPWLVTRRGPLGRQLDGIPWPVVDIRQAKNVEQELVKYLVKDFAIVDGEKQFIAPELYARIYEALAGLRTITASRGFWAPPKEPAHCPTCGSCDFFQYILGRGDVAWAVVSLLRSMAGVQGWPTRAGPAP